MAARDDIVSFCDELLEIERFEDYAPNGLQVPGAEHVEAVVSGVSANLELLRQAGSAGLVLVHHGVFWEGADRALSPALAERLRLLLGAHVSLAAYHLPLDAHPEIGNTALLCAGLGLEPAGRFGRVKGTEIGLIGQAPDGLSAAQLSDRVEALTGREPLVFAEGPAEIRSVGIVSGGGASTLEEAASAGLDALVTGEPSEPALASARESGLHFLAAGHHATEIFGIRRLGELVADRFGIEHRFIDIPNPV